MSQPIIKIQKLCASIEKKEILRGVDLTINAGEICHLVGANGSGKSTLFNIIMGDPRFKITDGEIIFKNQKINAWSPEKRAAAGIFLSFQHPREIEGAPFDRFLFLAHNTLAKKRKQKILSVFEFREKLTKAADTLGIKPEFLGRDLNRGFSGGEKKKMEILQAIILDAELIILDEIDAGLDASSLKSICAAIQKLKQQGKTFLIATHQEKMLDYLKVSKQYSINNGETK